MIDSAEARFLTFREECQSRGIFENKHDHIVLFGRFAEQSIIVSFWLRVVYLELDGLLF